MRGNKKILFIILALVTAFSVTISSVPETFAALKCTAKKKTCCSKQDSQCSHSESMKNTCCCYKQAPAEGIAVQSYDNPQVKYSAEIPSVSADLSKTLFYSQAPHSNNHSHKDRCVLHCIFRV